MSHMIHYILINGDTGAPKEELSCEASASIEKDRNSVFDYLDECPVDDQGKYLETISYRQAPDIFLSILGRLRKERLAELRIQLEMLAEYLGVDKPDGATVITETGARLFTLIAEGIERMKQGNGNTLLPGEIIWNLKILSSLVCSDYTFESGFYDAVIRHNTIIPTENEIREIGNKLKEDEDLFLVPLDLHF